MSKAILKDQVAETIVKWADAAYAAAKKDWRKAQDNFLLIADKELSNLSPQLATAIEDTVWRSFGNQAINSIIQRDRAMATATPPTVQPTTGNGGTPNSVHTSGGGLDRVEKVVIFEDTFQLASCKKMIGDATLGDLEKERGRAQSNSDTYGKHASLYGGVIDKMIAAGAGPKTKARDVVPPDYFAELRKRIYG